MLGTLLLLFIVLPALDLFLLLQIGARIGIYKTLLLVIGTGFAGAVLYRSQKWINFQRMQRTLQQGRLPDREMIDTILIMVGALLLITPGILTDILGFSLLLPFTRPLVRKGLIAWFKRSNIQTDVHIGTGPAQDGSDVDPAEPRL